MTNDMYVLLAVVLLLILSAIPVTASASLYAGGILFFIVWFTAYNNKTLFPFGQELYKQGGPMP
jgi:hypothetical protein